MCCHPPSQLAQLGWQGKVSYKGKGLQRTAPKGWPVSEEGLFIQGYIKVSPYHE